MHKEHEKYRTYSDEWLIDRYFQAGSVDEALLAREGIPFSFADMHRKLEAAGIIKSAGRHSSLSEVLHFFYAKYMEPGMPLERLYTHMPASFQTSVQTLHRIYGRVLAAKHSAIPTRHATALLIESRQNTGDILVGRELFSQEKYGKQAGLFTIPMTFSRARETQYERIIRVIQQEVLTTEAINKQFMNVDFVADILEELEGPFLTYRILDVEISCYKLTLPSLTKFSSYKLSDHSFISYETLCNRSDIRIGVQDIVSHYFEEDLKEELYCESVLNLAFASE